MNAQLKNLDIDLADIPTLGDELLLRLNTIREAAPIYWSDIQQGWFVTRHADVWDGFLGKLPLSSARMGKVAFAAIPENEWASRIPLLTGAAPAFANYNDPPYHSRLRNALLSSVKKSRVEILRPFVKERVKELLDQAQALKEFEFIDVIGRPLTASVIMRLMGMPQRYLPKMKGWVDDIINALGTPKPAPMLLEHGERAMLEMNTAFKEELAARKMDPRDDLLTVLARASEGENGFTEYELLGTCVNTLLAGHESTSSTAALGVAALAKRPDQVAYMLNHLDGIAEGVAEIGRFVGMSASQTRIASADFEWHGQKISKGEVIYLWVASASRDPRVFTNPDELDLSRNNANERSVVFGGGIHQCLGHLLAKLELAEFFVPAFRRFDWALLDENLLFSGGYSFRPLAALNVKVTPRIAG